MKLVFSQLVVLSITLLLFGATSTAQNTTTVDAWESKSVSDWNEDDVRKILQGSAWSRQVSGRPSHNSQQLGTVVYESRLLFTLRSSLLVRLAIVRSEQLKAKFDSMDEKAKAEFNKRFKPILDCELCEKSYIVAVRGDSQLLRQAARVKNRAANIYLSNDKGEKRELQSFTPQVIPGSEALFFFNRFDANGKPLLSPDDSVLTFNFKLEADDDSVIMLLERVNIKVRDIVRENQVIF